MQVNSGSGRSGDWRCTKCGAQVFASKPACFKCGSVKPGGQGRNRAPARGGLVFVPTPMMDDGVEYCGPLISFVRSNGEAWEDSEEEDEDEGGQENGEESCGGSSGEADRKLSKHFEAAVSVSRLAPQEEGAAAEGRVVDVAEGVGGKVRPGKVDRSALLQQKKVAGSSALDSGMIGFTILQRMGWKEGFGLGKKSDGHLLPVAVRDAPLIEGVGLGCTRLPDELLIAVNVEQMIQDFLADPTSTDLAFEPDLAKACATTQCRCHPVSCRVTSCLA